MLCEVPDLAVAQSEATVVAQYAQSLASYAAPPFIPVWLRAEFCLLIIVASLVLLVKAYSGK